MNLFGKENNSADKKRDQISRKSFLKGLGTLAVSGGVVGASGYLFSTDADAKKNVAVNNTASKKAGIAPAKVKLDTDRVAADPTDIPAPIRRNHSITHEVTLETSEVVAEIEPGVSFKYMTFNGQIPGPMIRVRQGDTVRLTLKNVGNSMVHNIDLHAVYGTGGGAENTRVAPGQSRTIEFKTMYPGAFIYHCAVTNMDYHISSGMFGMIVVEPKEGLPKVDQEIYLGQNEIYTDKKTGEKGFHNFSFDNMAAENPTYVLLNGEKHALTDAVHGAIKAQSGQKVRVFMVNGGPNLTSSFHPIGNVWTKAWNEGAVLSTPSQYVQTLPVPPGSTAVLEMDLPLAQKVKLVDHALSRVARKGMLGIIDVKGDPRPDIFNPNVNV